MDNVQGSEHYWQSFPRFFEEIHNDIVQFECAFFCGGGGVGVEDKYSPFLHITLKTNARTWTTLSGEFEVEQGMLDLSSDMGMLV